MKTVVLGGFMGCGKTEIGKRLSEKLGFSFIDTDEYVKNLTGRSIHDMLLEGRLDRVRSLEKQAVEELCRVRNSVIATGAGVLAGEENGEAFHSVHTIVYLRRDFDIVYPVISRDPVRVLAYGKSYAELKALYELREPVYERYADITVSNNGSPENCVREILERLNNPVDK